jgi:cobalamin biosynthesis protein CobT
MIGEEKIQVAISGAVAFANLLTTLRVNTEVMGFTESYEDDNNVSYVFKPFGKVVQQDTLIEYMCEGTKDMSNNADGDSLLVAYSRIMRQKTARKIIIVLSDGSPAATRGDIYGFTQEVIKNIEEKSPVEILGIGIMDDNVEALYKHHKVVYTLDKLPEVLIQTLESVILEK